MRRVLVFAAFLLLLGLSTATAASFDVHAEDITSFSESVTITTLPPPVPPVPSDKPWFLFRAPPAPGGLSQDPELGGPHKWKVFPLTAGQTPLSESHPDRYYVFSSGPLPQPMAFVKQDVTFTPYLTAGGSGVTAMLLDCAPGASLPSTDCTVIAQGTSTGSDGVIVFPDVDYPSLSADDELRLKVVNVGTQFWQLEWGYKTNRESNLVVSAPGP